MAQHKKEFTECDCCKADSYMNSRMKFSKMFGFDVCSDCVEFLKVFSSKTKVSKSEKLYELLDSLREGIANVSRSKTVTVQNDVDELDRLAGLANQCVGMVIHNRT